MKVCVIGLGYIGLPTAALVAAAGHKVVGVDTNPAIVNSINSGSSHIQEPRLGTLVEDVVRRGLLVAQQTPAEADVFSIAVPTPINDDKTADLSYVVQASMSVVPYFQQGSLFIIESTIPPGCTDDTVIPILEESDLVAGKDFYVAHCPERVIPGNVIHELVYNDRIVGGINPESAEMAKAFYTTFVRGDIYTTGLKEAEITKLAENAYRDVNIAFANEMAAICEKLNINVWDIVRMANRHPRVNILSPGPGVGGHCIAVDPWFLVEACPCETRLTVAAREVNDRRPERIASQVAASLTRCNVEKPVVACLGLTYKADVCDFRGSPSLEVVAHLSNMGFEVRICDPYSNGESPLDCVTLEEAVDGADAMVLLVDHKEYTCLDVEALTELMRHRIVIDTKGVWNTKNNDIREPRDWQQETSVRKIMDAVLVNSS